MSGHHIIVIGGSAGGLDGVHAILSGLSAKLPASVFIVLHTSPHSPGLYPKIFNEWGPLPAAYAVDGEPVTPGRIYVAPADRHLILEVGRVRVARGPKENRFRPAVDPLFRSAALAYGPHVVGVVLSGWLDDGAYGLWAVKVRGGIGIVQDPEEAFARSMPEAALLQARVDYCLPVANIAPILMTLANQPAAESASFTTPRELEIETRIAMGDNAVRAGVFDIGEPSPFACPECHGTLMRLMTEGGVRFRCHTGHSFTADTLLAEMTELVEGTLWNAIRSVQESSLLMNHIADHLRRGGDGALAQVYERKAAEARERADRVRQIVMRHEKLSGDKLAETAAG